MGPQYQGPGIQSFLWGLNPRAQVFRPFCGASISGPRYSVLFVEPQSQVQVFRPFCGASIPGPTGIQASVWGLNPRPQVFRPLCGASIPGPYSGLLWRLNPWAQVFRSIWGLNPRALFSREGRFRNLFLEFYTIAGCLRFP